MMAKTSAAQEAPARPHTLTLNSRKALSLTGVKDVSSFDEKQLILHTEGGPLIIDGDGLHVTALLLDEGRVSIEGQINAMTYSGRNAARKGFGGLFR
ncbi:MAG: sporulation protein YabP [Clostridia bacterium]|nr:sporulation protein YabP [Clostridia bacterium]